MKRSTGFAERLKQILEENHLSQIDLAGKIGVSQAAVSLWLRGTVPSRRRIEKIAIYLGLNENWLERGEGTKNLSPSERQARKRATVVERRTVQQLMENSQSPGRLVILRDLSTQTDTSFVFDRATDEQWALIIAQIEASYYVVEDSGRRSHPAL